MMRGTIQTPLISLSESIYRALLIVYPAEYRREYGSLMVQVFRDVCRDSYRRQGLMGILLWWCSTLLDLALTAFQERRKVRVMISKQSFAQLAGVFLIAGGACSAIGALSQLQPDDHYSYYGVYQLLLLLIAPGFFLTGLGCIALALRYGQELNTARKWLLILSGVGSLASALSMVAMLIIDDLWNVWTSTTVVYFVLLAAFGLLHVFKPVLPCFRALPLMIAGGWFALWLGVINTSNQTANNLLALLIFGGMGLAWLAIGLAVNRQGREAGRVAEAAA
jgi:hypothetical protein